jgi:hypothetical protein
MPQERELSELSIPTVIIRSWGRTQTGTTHRGWRWDVSVSVLNSLTKYACQRNFAGVASRHSWISTTAEGGLVPVTQLVIREQTHSRSSKLLET